MSISYRPPFVGIGTGRCGTTSLSVIVNHCHRTRVTHEHYSLPWYGVDERIGKLIREFRESAKAGILAGDVGQCLGPNVVHIRSSFPDLRVVCLHRDRAETIKSFKDYGWQKLRPDDKRAWLDRCHDPKDSSLARSIKCFPVIDGYTVDQACGFYWDMYEEIMSHISDPVYHVDTDDLNDDKKLGLLFDFLEVPEADRQLLPNRKHWTKEQVDKFKKEARRVTAD